jgi:ubiquinone/menaquinone biosynthesis C-methylase UbiE
VDIVFLLSAVHEIRNNEEKVTFLKECHRICKPGGEIIMVEHLRDFPNFLAFSVGFTHFFSRAVWKRAFDRAGFSSFSERKFTPFLSIFHCKP